ncbi:hypothetical protein GCM10010912_11450 [Paenibacillus albidus]|uniref:Uncharacterized protein n=1 Tax=Paenibacillus albidus TaxID=2041023 RepID=A0A917C219_9BACL|nr:hypothetical protein GCM10010912_11450 [Paenibacillus albidus]
MSALHRCSNFVGLDDSQPGIEVTPALSLKEHIVPGMCNYAGHFTSMTPYTFIGIGNNKPVHDISSLTLLSTNLVCSK